MITSHTGPWFEATPRRKNWTVKTPCLKCGLIHDEPTAICDGYVGIDPDETSGDSRKQAAARIRAVLAAVPIESHRGGRARAAAAAAGARSSQSPETPSEAAGRAEAPPEEVPEWRKEVSERLESYRSRRERQRAANQSVLEFRVHSRTETLEHASEAAAPTHEVSDAPMAEPIATAPAANEFSGAPTALAAAIGTAAPALPNPSEAGADPGKSELRTYQPVEEADVTDDLTADITEIVSRVAGTGEPAHAAVEEPAKSTLVESLEASAAIPIAAEPAVVLADSSTLEVHADPAELADVQPVEAGPQQPALAAADAPLASIPDIDTEYWHSVPGPEANEAECGSLTSGYEESVARHREEEEEREVEPVEELAHEKFVPADEPELTAIAEARSLALPGEPPSPLPPESEAPTVAALSEPSASRESLFPEALESTEGEEISDRRAALRTAARPLPGAAQERIEIRVPQPVFDLSPNNLEVHQPQDEALPVADLRERRCAAILDAALLGFTVAGFFLAFHIAGGELVFSRAGAAVSIATAFLIYSQYVLLFTVVGGATPGMVLRGLRVVCFDGKAPTTAELGWRSFGYLLSAAAGMLGFLWSAWDEHGLSWHDRISQTYITYAEPEIVPAALTTQ